MSMTQAKYKATWSDAEDSHEVPIATYSDVLDVLDQIGPQPSPAPILEVFEAETRRAIGVGIGKNRTVITYQDSLDPPYFISQGNPNEDGIETFVYGGESTEYLAVNLVNLARGFGALREFFETNGRPTTCAWETL